MTLLLKLGASASGLLANSPKHCGGFRWLPTCSARFPLDIYRASAAGSGDIRRRGSGNIGATNVARVAGSFPAVLTLLLDAGKGYFAVWLAARMTGGSIRWMVLAGLLATGGAPLSRCGLDFMGDVAWLPALGVFLPVCWQAVPSRWSCGLLVVAFWRYVSLASISAAASLPLLIYLLYAPGHAPPVAVIGGNFCRRWYS